MRSVAPATTTGTWALGSFTELNLTPAAAAPPVEVSAGEQNVTVTVSITWEIQ